MKMVRVGAAVLNQTPLDWDGNQRNIVRAIEAARDDGVQILCLPEMCVTGYGCEDAFNSIGTINTAWEMLQDTLHHTQGMVVSFGLPILHQNAVFNCAALACDGRILGFTAKQHLAGDGLHYEPRWFRPWPADLLDQIELGDRTYPIGDVFYDCGGVKIGFEICEDAWVAERPGAGLARLGADIILNPSASHFAFGKIDVRRRFVQEGSRAFGVTYVYSNLLGNEGGRIVYDGGTIISSSGNLIVEGPRFSFEDFVLTAATVDIDATRMKQSRTASFRPNLATEQTSCIECEFEWEERAISSDIEGRADWETGAHIKEEEFARAISLALFDYMRKSGSRGFVVSLSGGADSAAVASLCAMMVHLSRAELGDEKFADKLHLGPDKMADPIGTTLTCVYQSTKNSSDVTRDAATGLAEALGARFMHLDVDSMVDSYVEMIEGAIERDLTWETDDITLQNIQARARAPGVWMIANIENALLLATSNRSEAAVGYATMDGDTCGGLSPIAGIDKAFLRHWLRWLEGTGLSTGDEVWSVPALNAVNVQQPTAELRPSSEGQTDEGDLMPYAVLDEIERAAIRDKLPPLEVYMRMRAELPEIGPAQMGAWVEKFFKLWCRNQWKRERYAPSFHVDDENLDPKTWCRFPILSGGFRRELAQLREHVEQEAG